ncbi:hypothetical protein ACOSP7_025344 [Xanthoceras sorbifolium]
MAMTMSCYIWSFDRGKAHQWVCDVKHVFRECNRVADGLASLGRNLKIGIRFYEEPPPQISGLLMDDFCCLPTIVEERRPSLTAIAGYPQILRMIFGVSTATFLALLVALQGVGDLVADDHHHEVVTVTTKEIEVVDLLQDSLLNHQVIADPDTLHSRENAHGQNPKGRSERVDQNGNSGEHYKVRCICIPSSFLRLVCNRKR